MSVKRVWMDGDTMRVDEISPEDFYRQPKEASMADKIDTSTLGRIDLASGKSPAPIEECVSTWAVDDRIQSLIAENEQLREALARLASPVRFEYQFVYEFGARCRFAKAALSHKDMSRG